MKKSLVFANVVIILALTAALLILSVNGPSVNASSSLPTVQFLGEGPGTYNTILEEFIVGRGNGVYDLVPGSSYSAASGERVWGVSGANNVPPTAYSQAEHDLDPVVKDCVVDYVGIDDDVDGVRNSFWVGGDRVELITEGMTFEGSFVIPNDSTQFRLAVGEINYIALWYTPCTESVYLPLIFK